MAKTKNDNSEKKKELLEEVSKDEVKNIDETKVEQVYVSPKIDVQSIKNDLTDYMRMRIDKEVSEAVEKANKKIIHHKNSIIIKRDIFIVILLVICFFLGYNLYNVSNINIDITRTTKDQVSSKSDSSKQEVKEEETKEKSLDDKIKEYGSLIDDIYIDENSEYLKDFYNGNLEEEAKLYMALNKLDNITSEDEAIYIDDEDLKKAYEKLFDTEFNPKNFKYGDYSFRHLNSKSIFIADGEFKKVNSNITKDIIEIDEEENKIKITTVEGIIKDKKLYDLSLKEIKKYNGEDLKNYEKSLDKMRYEFVKKDDGYKLTKIEKGN